MDRCQLENNLNGSKVTSLVNDNKNKKTIFVSSKIKKILNWTKEEDEVLMRLAKRNGYKNWKEVSNHLPGRSAIQCSARYKRIRPGIVKGAWTIEEDDTLLGYILKFGKNWSLISKYMPSRSGKQIRDRYLNALDPNILREKFTPEEDEKIIEMYHVYGTQWSKIAQFVPKRTGDMIKNRFYSTLRKKIHSDDYRAGLNKRKRKNSQANVENTRTVNEKDKMEHFQDFLNSSTITKKKRRRIIKSNKKKKNTAQAVKKKVDVKIDDEDGTENFVFKPQPISKSNSYDSQKKVNLYYPSITQAPMISHFQTIDTSISDLLPNLVNNNLTKNESDRINQDDLQNQLNLLKQFLYITHSKLNMFNNEVYNDYSGVSQVESDLLNRALQLNIATQINNISMQLASDNPMSNFRLNYCGKK